MTNALVAQCGGPTAVVNASLAAVVERWRETSGAGRIFGSRFGMEGLARSDWVDLVSVTPETLATLAGQPGAALGSSRYRPQDDEMPAIVAQLHQAGVEALFLIGGNGTMAAAGCLNAIAGARGVPLRVVGIPKTIDNDLAGTAVTPGYGSAARFIAHTTQDVGLDLRAMRGFDQVAVMEVMGRHAGWLAAASALARHAPGEPPHLILVPEAPTAIHVVLRRIGEVFAAKGVCVVVAAEGVRSPDGNCWAELLGDAGQDPSGQRVFSMSAGVSAVLAQRIQAELGLRVRQVRLNTAQRSGRALVSPVDRMLAHQVGIAAVDAWSAGASGVMVSLARNTDEWTTRTVAVDDVIGRERLLPAAWIDADGFDVKSEALAYIAAVASPLPPAPVLWTDRCQVCKIAEGA